MFENLKRLFLTGKLDGRALANAITKGWITQEQYDEIIALQVIN